MANVEEVTPPLANMHLSNVVFNYDNVYIELPCFDLVNPLIDEKRDVVLFGDENFTLFVAFAALRQSWDGIKVNMPECNRIVTTAKLTCIDYCIKNGEKLKVEDATKVNAIKQILHLSTTLPGESCLHNVFPTSIPNEVSFQKKIVWYQMPWVTTADYNKGTYLLIEQFLDAVSPKQDVGDYLLIGVTNLFPYVRAYEISRLHTFTNGYRLIGATKDLVEMLLKYGYMKEGPRDLHNSVLCHHVTLVFERK